MVASRMCPKEPQRTWEEKPPRTLGRAIGGVSKDMSGSGPRRVPLPPPPLPPAPSPGCGKEHRGSPGSVPY